MKKFVIVLIAGILSTLSANAQLGKQMSKYHEKDGITVTQLDKSLYGLYQRSNLAPETREMLQKLDEINLMSVNLEVCPADLSEKIINQFRGILGQSDKYRLVKSNNTGYSKQLIYTQQKNGKTTDLVVCNQTPEQIEWIELRGDIQLEQVTSLPQALNLQGLRPLAALSSDSSTDEDWSEELTEMRRATEAMRNGGIFENFSNLFDRFFGINPTDSASNRSPFASSFGQMDKFSDLFGQFDFPNKEMFEQLGDDSRSMSSSIQLIEKDGKTDLKIDTENTDITYVIDGKEAPKDSVQVPEKIRNINLVPSRTDMTKSYLFITSQNPLGHFSSFKEGVLTFKYDNQEFKYNLEKTAKPILVIDGRLSAALDINPADILQIRPVSQIEREAGYYPDAEVIINTRQQFPF